MKIKHGVLLGAILGLAATQIAMADDPNALQLIKNGDEYVGMPSRDKVLEVYSEKSVAHLEPNVWHIVYYDPSVMSGSVEVKFGAGQEMAVSHPIVRPFAFPARARDVLDQSKLRVDSDQALHTAASQRLLDGLTLRASKLTLESTDDGIVWKVELWAAKKNDQTKEAWIGYVSVSANDGSIIQSDLHPSRID